ncbi:MAG: hypothetical protein ACRD0W_08345, partial [Acidimicrobiales bacterium]
MPPRSSTWPAGPEHPPYDQRFAGLGREGGNDQDPVPVGVVVPEDVARGRDGENGGYQRPGEGGVIQGADQSQPGRQHRHVDPGVVVAKGATVGRRHQVGPGQGGTGDRAEHAGCLLPHHGPPAGGVDRL